LKVEPPEQDAEYNFYKVKLYFLLGTVISGVPFNFVGTRVRTKPVRPAFLKLWSADHKWSSGSALVVLLD